MGKQRGDPAVVYCLGDSYTARFMVSLLSLRQVAGWRGRVIAYLAGNRRDMIAKQVSNEERLNVSCIPVEPLPGPAETVLMAQKLRVINLTEAGDVVFLDADTMPLAGFAPESMIDSGVPLTFTCMTPESTCDPRPRQSLLEWSGINAEIDRLVEQATQSRHPAVNTGVFSAAPGAIELENWERLAMLGLAHGRPIPDEAAAQLLIPSWTAGTHFALKRASWNSSAISLGGSPGAQPFVVHFHGESHRCSLVAKAVDWWTLLAELWTDNVASIRDWGTQVADRDLHLIAKLPLHPSRDSEP